MNANTNDIPGMPMLCQDRETGTFCPVKSGISVWLIQNFMLYAVHPHDTDIFWHVGMIPGANEPCPTPGAISANISSPHSMQLGTRLPRYRCTYIYRSLMVTCITRKSAREPYYLRYDSLSRIYLMLWVSSAYQYGAGFIDDKANIYPWNTQFTVGLCHLIQ